MALTQGDVAFLPLAGEQFSKVLSIQTFYFWPEPLQTLRQLFCVLKRPGTLIVTLSTGVIGPDGERTPGPFGSLQDRLEQQIIPGMYDMGFTTAYLR
jgi:ubiquinone/menaquinone biosynthesis C-methylase UbiE